VRKPVIGDTLHQLCVRQSSITRYHCVTVAAPPRELQRCCQSFELDKAGRQAVSGHAKSE